MILIYYNNKKPFYKLFFHTYLLWNGGDKFQYHCSLQFLGEEQSMRFRASQALALYSGEQL